MMKFANEDDLRSWLSEEKWVPYDRPDLHPSWPDGRNVTRWIEMGYGSLDDAARRNAHLIQCTDDSPCNRRECDDCFRRHGGDPDSVRTESRVCRDCGRHEDEIAHPTNPDACPACDGPLVNEDRTTSKFGDRVKIAPHTDYWMRGDRYGVVVHGSLPCSHTLVVLSPSKERVWLNEHDFEVVSYTEGKVRS